MKIGIYGPAGDPMVEVDLTGWSREYFLASNRVILTDGNDIIRYRLIKEDEEKPIVKKNLSAGWLCYIDDKWVVKWSDLHSFSQGTIWSYSPLIDEQQSLPNLVHDKKIEFEHIHHIIDTENFHSILLAKIFNENSENT